MSVNYLSDISWKLSSAMTKTLPAVEEAFISVDKEKENIGQGGGR